MLVCLIIAVFQSGRNQTDFLIFLTVFNLHFFSHRFCHCSHHIPYRRLPRTCYNPSPLDCKATSPLKPLETIVLYHCIPVCIIFMKHLQRSGVPWGSIQFLLDPPNTTVLGCGKGFRAALIGPPMILKLLDAYSL